MTRPLRVLVVEDREDDAVMLLRELERSGYSVRATRVESANGMTQALAAETWDVVLSDYSLPGFGALSALELLKASGQDLPFLIVSGTIGEETAVECLRAGAHDFLVKGRMARLSSAIDREMRAARMRARQREEHERNRQLETARALAEDRLRIVIEAAPNAMIMVDANRSMVLLNAQAEAIFGFPRDSLLGRPIGVLLPSVFGIEPMGPADAMPKPTNGEDLGREVHGRRQDGSEIPLEVVLIPFRTSEGAFQLVSLVDITARKATAAALQESEQRFRQIAENIDEVFWMTDVTKKQMLYISPGYELVWGRSCQSLREHPESWFDAIHPEDRPRIAAAVAEKQHRGDYDETYRIVRPDGAVRWIRDRAFPIRDEHGRVYRVAGIAANTTDYRVLEEQFHQSQKLEAVGRLASGVAHEINTPTQFIGDNVRFLRDAFADLDKLIDATKILTSTLDDTKMGAALTSLANLHGTVDFDYLRAECPLAITQSLDGVDRVAKIVHAMKDFARADRSEKAVVDVNRVIRSAITVCRNEWKFVAEVDEQLEEELPTVNGFAQDLGQVILNLVVNAAHAIGEKTGGQQKGTITVRSRSNGDAVDIEIQDTGAGIPDAIKPRIFEQFFTTKAVGKGTGQGLAIAHRIVTHKHGGRLVFTSESGNGTTFRLSLPRA